MKYDEIGKSIWTNEYLVNARNILKTEKIDLELGFDKSEFVLHDVNNLFKDQLD